MPNPNLTFATALVATLADLGVEHACLSPGSRNTPLLAAFAAQGRIWKWPVLDERSAGFFAVGLAKSTGKPVVLACTSGTAAVEYHPAVVEASQSDVPLLVLTADRPEELRGIGAPQTIDQISLYGTSTRLFLDVPAPSETTTPQLAIDLAREAWSAATLRRPGPVHLNLPFAEPLLSESAAVPVSEPLPLPDLPAPLSLDLTNLGARIANRNGIIVAGRSNDPTLPTACSELAEATGYPILADPLSGLRHGSHPLDRVLGYGDAMVAAGVLDSLQPDLVLRFGPVPTSKPTWQWLESHPQVEQILVEVSELDATRSATTVLAEAPTAVAAALALAVPAVKPRQWTKRWNELDRTTATIIQQALLDAPFPNEPAIAQTVVDAAPAGTQLTIGSSMPIRDVDTFGGKSTKPIRLFGNRGTNGIDGVVSAALGSAATSRPAVVLLGDVSLFHDLSALGTATQLGLPITIVVIHNDGGGIFNFLPQNDPEVMDPAAFETYLATPHQTDFVAVASALGVETHAITAANELARLVATPTPGPRLLQLRTDRKANLELHRKIAATVKRSLASRGAV